jgi:hypothetical protein
MHHDGLVCVMCCSQPSCAHLGTCAGVCWGCYQYVWKEPTAAVVQMCGTCDLSAGLCWQLAPTPCCMGAACVLGHTYAKAAWVLSSSPKCPEVPTAHEASVSSCFVHCQEIRSWLGMWVWHMTLPRADHWCTADRQQQRAHTTRISTDECCSHTRVHASW